jgi:hypothetical protein
VQFSEVNPWSETSIEIVFDAFRGYWLPDFFRMVIEERKRTGKREDLSEIEIDRLSGALKVFANSTSYEIYGQVDRQESGVRCNVFWS